MQEVKTGVNNHKYLYLQYLKIGLYYIIGLVNN